MLVSPIGSTFQLSHLAEPVQRFSKFLESVLLPLEPELMVIFIDEIDSVRNLPFNTNNFFVAIRSVYNQRSLDANYRRLTFALIGAATPVDLIQGQQTSAITVLF